MAREVLLLEDVEHVGRAGQVIKNLRPGFIRNWLIPQKKAIIADAHALRLQKRLQEERAAKAARDLEEATSLAAQLEPLVLQTIVKVDPEGHMYGSVSAGDVTHLLEQQYQLHLERRYVQLERPIKELGTHKIVFKLPEGVRAECTLEIIAEEG